MKGERGKESEIMFSRSQSYCLGEKRDANQNRGAPAYGIWKCCLESQPTLF